MPRFSGRLWAAFFLPIALLAASVTPTAAATLLPPGKQTFFDQNGAPLSRGSVQFFIPGTTTPKTTWQNAAQTIANQNPVPLDSSGQAIIYGSGCYRQIVRNVTGATIWDQPTCDTANAQTSWGGTAGGTANTITATASNFTSEDGQAIAFIASATNTGPTTFNGVNILKDTLSGPFSLSGGEIGKNNLIQLVYDKARGAFHLVNNPVVGSSPLATITAGATVDLGSAASRYVKVTGSATAISSFGGSASLNFPFYTLAFDGSYTLVASGNLGLPSAGNIATNAGDYALAVYLGGTAWQVYAYFPKSRPLERRVITNLTCSNDPATPSKKFRVSADAANLISAAGVSLPVTSPSVTIDATTVGPNGLDTGALANASWYHAYVASNGTNVVGLLSLSSVSPILPTGYIYYARACAVPTDGSANFKRVRQAGARAQYIVTTASNTPTIPTFATGIQGTQPTSGPPTTYTAYTVRGPANLVPPTATRASVFVSTQASNASAAIAPSAAYGAVVLTGTITSTTSSTAVTGVGTKFTTELLVGMGIANNSGTLIGTVSAIADDTHLTLGANAAVAVTTGAYQTIPTFPPIRVHEYNGFGNTPSTGGVTDLMLEGDSLYYQSDDANARAGILGWTDTSLAN